jgi:hypothetical protein
MNPVIVDKLPDTYAGPAIYLGQKGAWRDVLVKESFPGAESYILRVQQDAAGRTALVATGADMRGSIYAAYALSEEILGVDPWYFWVDREPAPKSSIAVPEGLNIKSGVPTFKYRGWFMNDEDLLSRFSPDPLRENVFSIEMYDRIYETLLRLKANMVAPATFPFPDERCQELAARRGLVINMHHILVLGLNTYRWPKDVPFSYSKHPLIMEAYWQACIDAFKDYEVVWTVGYRGKHDRPFWSDEPELKTSQERGALITGAIAKQVEMIRKAHPNDDIIANLWMEGATLYQEGFLKLPEGVTLVWADDGGGIIRDKGQVQEGQGIYYHTAMLNGRANQLSEMVRPEVIYNQVLRFVKAKATTFFLVNVSDIRPIPLSTDCAMKLVWNAAPYLNKTDEENMDNFLQDWSQRQFGSAIAGKIAAKYKGYFDIPYMKASSKSLIDRGTIGGGGDNTIHSNIRSMDRIATLVKENKPLNEEALKKCREHLQFSVENRTYIAKLVNQATPLKAQAPDDRKDFYQGHLLTQLQIHLNSLAILEFYCQSLLACHSGNKANAIAQSEKALQSCKELFANLRKAEYGKWATWYRGECFVGLESTYDRIRSMNAFLRNEPAPPLRKSRGYGDVEKYQEPFSKNFPLLYPEN